METLKSSWNWVKSWWTTEEEKRFNEKQRNIIRNTSNSRLYDIEVPTTSKNSKMELPDTLPGLKLVMEGTGSFKLTQFLKGEVDFKNLTPTAKLAVQYSIPGVRHGRPLNNVLIMMAGESGTGKSTTINKLFDDDELCQVSDSKSETSDVHQCTKSLRVTDVDPDLLSALIFVDVPGSLDTDSRREALNQAKIKSFRKQHPSLIRREVPLMLKPFNIASKVYPNVVLFVFDSSNKRLEGPDSSLMKSLKMLDKADIVDKTNKNLLVVGTNAASLPKRKEKFEERTQFLTNVLQEAVYSTLGVLKVTVIFLENKPEDCDLKKEDDSDFYLLPDGTLSHCNLINAMFETFRSTGDKLGHLLTSWYFHSACPDRPTKAINTVFEAIPANLEMEMVEAAKSTKFILNIDSTTIPTFDFHSLGYAYCPVTESKKSHYVLKNEKPFTVVVGQNSKFVVPGFVKTYKSNHTNFRKVSYETKEAYEYSKKSQYGLDCDMVLKVGVSSSGKWIRDGTSSTQESEVCVVSEICIATIQVDNPEEFIAEDVKTALQQLPSSYDQEPEKFNEFLSKYGTHFVNKVKIGGSIKMDCRVKTANYNSKLESNIEAKASGIFRAISFGGNYSTDSACKELESIGISDARITISGGVPPMVSSLADLTPEIFNEWVKTVQSDPTELDNNFSLYPYYNFDHCTHKAALRDATMAYLQQSLKAKILKRRDDIANKAKEEAKATDGSTCFPASTMVQIATGGMKKISDLRATDTLTTLVLGKAEDFHTKPTRFCTFLHKNPSTTARFLCLDFSNNKSLRVTHDHLLLAYSASQGLTAILAGSMKIGDSMLFVDGSGNVSSPKVVDIKLEYHVGVYSPLTSKGTFLADGFLVTSYGDIESFKVANAVMAPLRMWHSLKQSLQLKKSGRPVEDGLKVPNPERDGTHEYANLLIKLRKLVLK